jgi:hypothetical protein
MFEVSPRESLPLTSLTDLSWKAAIVSDYLIPQVALCEVFSFYGIMFDVSLQ